MAFGKNKVIFAYVPAIIDLFVQLAFINFEAILLGRLSPIVLAGAGIGGQVLLFLFVFLLTFAMGSSLLISLELGKGEKEKAREIFGRAVIYVFLLSILLAIICYSSAKFIFEQIFKTNYETNVIAKTYFRTLSLFLPIISIDFFIISLLRGTGETIKSMTLSLVVNLTNAFLSYTLIYGKFGIPLLGARGAAIAIGLSHTVGLILSISFFIRDKLNFKLLLIKGVDFGILKKLFKVGIPATLEQILWGIGQLFLVALISRTSIDELAVMQALFRIQMLVGIVYQAIGIVSLSFFARAVGAKSPRAIIRFSRTTFKLAILSALIFGLLFAFLPHQILQLFFTDKKAIALGSRVLRFIAILQISKASVISVSSLLRAKGDLIWLVVTNGVFMLFFEIFLGIVFVNTLGYGIFGAWAVMGLDESFKTLLHLKRATKTGIKNL
ncbi:MAG: MATE family efflux transporter [bacterium]